MGNGKVRKIPVLAKKAYALSTEAKRVRPALRTRKSKQLKLKKNLTPGAVCIILAGTHKGKRVVFLKQMPIGTCLVTGPYKLNGCPVRRVPQHLMITTSLKIDISSVKVPANMDDKYFSKKKAPICAYLNKPFELTRGMVPHKLNF